MSTEESSNEDDQLSFVVKKVTWESERLRKRKKSLDKSHEKTQSKRSRQRFVKRVRQEGITVPLKSKLPPLLSFLAIRVSFLSRHFSCLARCVSFLSRSTEAFSMGYITRKKPLTCNNCSAVCCQIDGTFQHKICIDRLLDSYRTRVMSNIERYYK